MHFYNELDVSYAKQHAFSKVTVTVFENYKYEYMKIIYVNCG